MSQYTVTTNARLTKEQFRQVVNEALCGNGEKAKSLKEIDEDYKFYSRLWEEDDCSGEIEMVESQGKMQLSFG